MLLTPLLVLSLLAEPVCYLIWYLRARRLAEQGMPLPPIYHRFLRRLDVVLGPVVLLLFLAFLSRDSGVAYPFFLVVLLIYLFIPLTHLLQYLCRRLGLDGGTSRLTVVFILLLLAFFMAFLVAPQLFALGEQGAFSAGAGERVTRWRDGEQVDYLQRDSLPLTLEDLGAGSDDQWSYELERYASPLLAMTTGEQRPAFSPIARFSYEIMEVRIPALTPAIVELAMETHSTFLFSRQYSWFVPIDAVPWGADEAYQSLWRNGQAQPVYLLREGSTVVYLSLPDDLPLTPAAVDTICEKLFP